MLELQRGIAVKARASKKLDFEAAQVDFAVYIFLYRYIV